MRSWLVSFLHLLFCSPHSFLPPAPIICLTQHCLLVVLSPDYLSRLFSNCFHSFSRLRPTSLKLSTFDRHSDNLVQPCTWTGFVGKTIRNLLCISERPDRRDSQSLDREICRDTGWPALITTAHKSSIHFIHNYKNTHSYAIDKHNVWHANTHI